MRDHLAGFEGARRTMDELNQRREDVARRRLDRVGRGDATAVAESARQQAESSRVTAEAERQAAEEDRDCAEAQRDVQEVLREQTEELRAIGEEVRETNERLRDLAEAARADAVRSAASVAAAVRVGQDATDRATELGKDVAAMRGELAELRHEADT
jgi:hypothetical protein